MPTIQEAIDQKLVVKIGGNLRRCQQPERLLLATPDVIEWMKNVLPRARSDDYVMGAASPLEQVVDLSNRFVSGQPLEWPFPHTMRPSDAGIYRVRTDDVRLNGWFPQKACFVTGSIDLKENCSTARDDELRDIAIEARTALQINNGHFLMGDYHEHL